MESARGDTAAEHPALDDLVARIAAGDCAAERDFVLRFQAGVRALARRHCRPNEPSVDDIVQEVLHRVLEQLRAGKLEDAAALPAYVRNAVVFAANAEYRKRARRAEDALGPAIDTLPAPDDPPTALGAAQVIARVRRLLSQLPVARDRELLLRFYVQEQPKERVCSDLAIDPGHFHRVVFRARSRLREMLEADGIGEAP